MTKSLVIVESPNKVKTINKYLGPDYHVASSVGHVLDLSSDSKWVDLIPSKRGVKLTRDQKYDRAVLKMGINPTTWDGDFIVMNNKEKVVSELKRLAKNCDEIYLATDLDREGEAIAWHLTQVLGKKHNYKRVIFNEITQDAIQKAFANPTELNINRVHAQQTRRYLDRMVGFLLSPLLCKKVGKNLSAGRVQSVALKLLVERERAIRLFVPVEYYKIYSSYKKLDFELEAIDGKRLTSPEDANTFFIPNEQEAQQHLDTINGNSAIVAEIEVKETKSSPKAPFTTSTLQQTASTKLGFGIKKTMTIAQILYESGYITYMRTDSTNLSAQSIAMATNYIKTNFGDKYLATSKRNYQSNNANSQEAHEAIRPTDVNQDSKSLSPDESKLYQLIKSQFLASQMTDAVYEATNIIAVVDKDHKYKLKSSAKFLKFAGYHKAFGVNEDNPQDLSGGLKQGDQIKLKAQFSQNFTSPPPRYTEASLVRELESRSIGRPSTYVSIVSLISDRGYATLVNKKFYVNKIAELMTYSLSAGFSKIMDYDFTSHMEATLDEIAEGKVNWTDELNQF